MACFWRSASLILPALTLLGACANPGQPLLRRTTAAPVGPLGDPQQNAGMRAVLERSSQQPSQRRSPDEPVRVDAQAQRFTSPLLRVLSTGNFASKENEWRNSGRERVPIGTGLTTVEAFLCHYNGSDAMGSPVYRYVTLWADQKPALAPAEVAGRPTGADYMGNVSADVAVSACPRTWGDALVAIWGPNAWTELKNSPEAKSSLARTVEIQNATIAADKAAWEALSEWERCYRTNYGNPRTYYDALSGTGINRNLGKDRAWLASVDAICGKR